MSSPSELEQIKSCLEEYFAAVDSQKTDQPQNLSDSLMALEQLSQNTKSEWPGKLSHYLESRSYRKAYLELGGERAN